MQKSVTASKKAQSKRNRHNGRINFAKSYILNHKDVESMTTRTGRKYKALRKVEYVPMPKGKPLTKISFSIVREGTAG